MKRIAIGLALAALAAGGAVYAAETMEHRGHGMRMMDADGDGVVTRAEAQAAGERMFTMMDVNKDGKIDPADREARHAARFDKIDTNHDGQISRAEYTAQRPWGRGTGGPGGDGSGHRMGGHGMGHRGHGGGMMMLRMADANKDGAVTREEHAAAALAHFDRADANHDGKLTAEERQAAHAAMRQQMHDRMQGGMDHHDGHDMTPPATPKQ